MSAVGYSIRQTGGEFFIAADDKERARRAVRERAGGSYPYVRDSWHSAATLEDLLADWRFEAQTDPESGDIVHLYFTGENAGEEEVVLSALAPFVRTGSKLIFAGADGDVFGFLFDGSACTRREATIEF